MYSLTVILRTCDRVNAFSGNRPRDFGTKQEVILKCVTSLKKSIDFFTSKGNSCNFIIVDDHSSKDTLDFLTNLSPTKIISLIDTGNGVSFATCVDLAKECEGLVFLVEDDYLLKEECILSMVESHFKIKEEYGIEACFHPCDYPDRYTTVYPSIIFLGSDRHYRTIRHTTCTFMYPSHIFKSHENVLKAFSSYGLIPGINEDNTINLVYKQNYCVSPIPSLAEHYQYTNTLSPFYEHREKV